MPSLTCSATVLCARRSAAGSPWRHQLREGDERSSFTTHGLTRLRDTRKCILSKSLGSGGLELDAEQPPNCWVMWKGPHHRSCIAGDSSCDVQRAGASASTSFAANFPQAQTMANFPEATHDCLDLAGLLNEEQRAVQLRVRAFMVRRFLVSVCQGETSAG